VCELLLATKDELFDAVCAGVIQDTAEEVRFSADAVPGFVGRLFDIYIKDPDIVRLYDRISMDGSRDFRSQGGNIYRIKVEGLRRAQEAGTVDPAWEPTVLLSMLLGIARLMATHTNYSNRARADGRRLRSAGLPRCERRKSSSGSRLI
jgi:hypothetical protein